MKQTTNGMASEIEHITKNQVADGAALDADFAFLNNFSEDWMHRELESMPNSLRIKQDCIVQVLIVLEVGLSS